MNSTPLTTRRVIDQLCSTHLYGYEGYFATYADKAWAILPNGSKRRLPLEYYGYYGANSLEPRHQPCDVDIIARLVRHASQVLIQRECCKDGSSVEDYTLYTRKPDNPHHWEKIIEFPEPIPF